jgi:homoserine kinase
MVKVFSPASIANVGPGFDVLGFAINDLGDIVEAEFNNSRKLLIQSINGTDGLPFEVDKNLTTIAAQALLSEVGDERGITFRIKKTVMPGSGLGSSASAAAAGAFAVNELLGKPFTKNDLVRFAGIGEQAASNQLHHDNVAPSMLGGFCVVRSNDPIDVFKIDYPEDLRIVIAHPQVEIKTKQAKRMLGRTMSISNAVIQFGNIAGLVSGMARKDYGLIGRSMVDVLAEPVRSKLIPEYDAAKIASLEAGAVGTNIAGSGPAIFSFCKGMDSAEEVKEAFKYVYSKTGLDVRYYISEINSVGTTLVN